MLLISSVNAPTSEVETTKSNVTVSSTVAIGMSANLTFGIRFETLDPNTNDNNATANYNNTDFNTTLYWITVETASNNNVDLCIGDDVALTSGGNTIPNSGYTFSVNETNNRTLPIEPSTTSIGTAGAYTSVTNNVPEGNRYFRFHLDVPNDQAAGDYGNCVSFKATVTGTACTSGAPPSGC